MALSAKLFLGKCDPFEHQFDVVDLSFHFSRQRNAMRPDSKARCESISFQLVSPRKDNLVLYDWYVSNILWSGLLSIELPPDHISEAGFIRNLSFSDARCFKLTENYDVMRLEQTMLTLHIFPASVIVDGEEFVN